MLVDLWWNRVPRLAVKVPDSPDALGLVTPYPELTESWNSGENEWGWTIPSLDALPDVRAAVDLVKPFHREDGPMITTSKRALASPE